jgi:sugar phosphate isomerase/epimerase
MSEWLLEIRLFTVEPGTREEWHEVTRDGTIPLMRKCGINVIAYGPSRNDDDGYYLVRSFENEEQRVAQAESFYATEEFTEKYEKALGAMMVSYRTSVVPLPREAIEQFARRVNG